MWSICYAYRDRRTIFYSELPAEGTRLILRKLKWYRTFMSLSTACLETWIPVSLWISLVIYLADHMDCWLPSLRSIAAVMSLNYLNRASSDFLLLIKRDFDLLRFLIRSHISCFLTLNLIASSSYESYRVAAAFTMLSLSVQERERRVRLLPLILMKIIIIILIN